MITLLHRWLSKPLAKNLREPDGLFGQITANMMNTTNAVMTDTAVDILDITPGHHVLDIGFGGGICLGQLLEKTRHGHVSGLEISETMLRRANNNYRKNILEYNLSLHQGAIEAMPFANNQFDRICTINTIYFWQNPHQAIAEMYRVCKTNGKIIIAFRPTEVMQHMKFTRHGFTLYQVDEVIDLLQNAGFQDINGQDFETDELGFSCITARKS